MKTNKNYSKLKASLAFLLILFSYVHLENSKNTKSVIDLDKPLKETQKDTVNPNLNQTTEVKPDDRKLQEKKSNNIIF